MCLQEMGALRAHVEMESSSRAKPPGDKLYDPPEAAAIKSRCCSGAVTALHCPPQGHSLWTWESNSICPNLVPRNTQQADAGVRRRTDFVPLVTERATHSTHVKAVHLQKGMCAPLLSVSEKLYTVIFKNENSHGIRVVDLVCSELFSLMLSSHTVKTL